MVMELNKTTDIVQIEEKVMFAYSLKLNWWIAIILFALSIPGLCTVEVLEVFF